MPKITLKFSEAPVKEPLDETEDYVLTIKKAEHKPTKDKTSMNLNVEFNVNGIPGGYTVYKSFNLQPQSLWSLRDFLNAVEGEEVYTEEDVDFDVEDLLGKEVGANVTNQTYQGKTNSVPTAFFPA